MSANNTQRGVPGIPLAALDAIEDQNTRQVLRAIVDGWHVRNGSTGKGDNRFVTASELGDLSGIVGGLRQSLTQEQAARQNHVLSASQIGRIITDLQASVMESVLFKELGDRITLINADLLAGLTAEAIARQAAITNEATIRQTEDTSLAQQITTVTAAVGTNAAAIQTEITARVNGDNSVTNYVNTQLSTVNGNLSALQTQQTTTANNVAALSQSVTTLQSTVGANTAAIQTEATARVNADNDIYAKYSVKIDVNGYVTGFGLISTANNSTPYSEFMVRADRFSIASPSGPGITPKVPFVVLTTTDSKGNAPGVYIDNAVIRNAAIGTAQIDDAAVNTLKIGGNAITVSTYAYGYVGANTLTDGSYTLCATAWVSISGLAAGETAGTIIAAYSTLYENGGSAATVETSIWINGAISATSGCTLGESKTNSLTSFAYAPNGVHRVDVYCRTNSSSGGASSKLMNGIVSGIIVMSGKR